MIAVYPGTFDPVTLGHLDIITRASQLFDNIIVAVSENEAKHPYFSLEERCELLRRSTAHLTNVSVEGYKGLTVDFLKEKKSKVLIRGIRNIIDCEFELSLQGMYKAYVPDIDIVLLPATSNLNFISSTLVRDLLKHNGTIDNFVPKEVVEYINYKIQK